MEQDQLNAAVRTCVQYCLGHERPLEALAAHVDHLRAHHLTEIEIDRVAAASHQILAMIYNADDAQPPE